ncbi:MAG: hypothetical protein KF841_02590 [Phycisphaerae bacterium]|nr:hypothetical protein [Phycisphaerae bacterium]
MNTKWTRIFVVAVAALLIGVAIGWNQTSPAQTLMKPASGGQKGWYGEFASLLGSHGNANMKLEVHATTASQGELIGTLSGSTDAFLIVKGLGEGKVYFITWDDVIWITARPN